LNASAEPELTMSMIPNAHAVLFLLSMDTGVTRSDLEVWKKHVQPRVARRLAVLNKIDLLWDDIKSEEEINESIARQLDMTARLLELPPGSVLPLSAQKALVARVRGDKALLERSGIRRWATARRRDHPGETGDPALGDQREISAMVSSRRRCLDSMPRA
jgi:hypothetical protein